MLGCKGARVQGGFGAGVRGRRGARGTGRPADLSLVGQTEGESGTIAYQKGMRATDLPFNFCLVGRF